MGGACPTYARERQAIKARPAPVSHSGNPRRRPRDTAAPAIGPLATDGAVARSRGYSSAQVCGSTISAARASEIAASRASPFAAVARVGSPTVPLGVTEPNGRQR